MCLVVLLTRFPWRVWCCLAARESQQRQNCGQAASVWSHLIDGRHNTSHLALSSHLTLHLIDDGRL